MLDVSEKKKISWPVDPWTSNSEPQPHTQHPTFGWIPSKQKAKGFSKAFYFFGEDHGIHILLNPHNLKSSGSSFQCHSPKILLSEHDQHGELPFCGWFTYFYHVPIFHHYVDLLDVIQLVNIKLNSQGYVQIIVHYIPIIISHHNQPKITLWSFNIAIESSLLYLSLDGDFP